MIKQITTSIIIVLILMSMTGFAIEPVIKADLMKQDPFPAEPGKYADLTFKIKNIGSDIANNLQIEFIDEYPFTINTEESRIISIGDLSNFKDKNEYIITYKAKVDGNALEGNYNAKIGYKFGFGNWIIEKFNVSVKNSGTEFDVILESIDEDVTLAIVNTGKNLAESIIVKASTDAFDIQGGTGSVIGNLEKGEYTFVNFNIKPVETKGNLNLEISYTDINGNRRTENKTIYLNMENYQEKKDTPTGGFLFGNTTFIIGFFVVIGIIYWYRRKRKKNED